MNPTDSTTRMLTSDFLLRFAQQIENLENLLARFALQISQHCVGLMK